MQRLRRSDIAALTPFVRSIYASEDFPSLVRRSVGGLRTILPSSHASYNDIDLRTGASQWFCDGPAHFAGIDNALAEHAHEHPIIMHYARSPDGAALKISDFLSESAFHRLGLYADLYRRMDVRYQIAVRLPSRARSVVDIALSRNGRDYNERERVILNALRPHLARAAECALATERANGYAGYLVRGLSALNYYVLVADRNGGICWHSPGAERVIDAYFNPARRAFGEFIRSWAAEIGRRLSTVDDVPPPVSPEFVGGPRGELTIYLVPGERYTTVILKERRANDEDELRRAGLSAREATILRMVSRGLTGRQIAAELAISWRTVGKHVEHICAKLGVKSRAAAIAAAQRVRQV